MANVYSLFAYRDWSDGPMLLKGCPACGGDLVSASGQSDYDGWPWKCLQCGRRAGWSAQVAILNRPARPGFHKGIPERAVA